VKKQLILLLILIAISGLLVTLYKTKKDIVEDALTDYHAKKGQSIIVKSVEYKNCSQNMPDSLEWKQAFSVASKSLDLSIVFTNFSDKERYKNAMQSENMCAAKIDSIRTALATRGKTPDNFTRCDYIATITTKKEQFTDTLIAILSDKMRVVWPN
jgi:hypothetical protein